MSSDGLPVFAACFNQPYIPHVATMLRSFSESALGPARWYLIRDDSVTPAVLRQLLDFTRVCGLAAEPLRVPDVLVAGFGDDGRFPQIAWHRTVLSEALPDEDRIVYVDGDVLFLHDPRALWEAALAPGDLFGAVRVPSWGINRECARLGLPADSPVFNSGVMVMDLALMREERFGPRVREFAQNPGRTLVYADQDAMNVLFTDRWTAIDPAWNCTTSILLPFVADASWDEDSNHDTFVLERAARSPAIVHFDGAPIMRPWHRRCFNPFADLYRYYRATTPWPLLELQGRPRDALLSRLPPRLQAKLWHLRHRGQRL